MYIEELILINFLLFHLSSSMQIALNETRDKVRQANQDVSLILHVSVRYHFLSATKFPNFIKT